jgi:hypothetical protein
MSTTAVDLCQCDQYLTSATTLSIRQHFASIGPAFDQPCGAQRLWTSVARLRGPGAGPGRQLCQLMNLALRLDDPALVAPLAVCRPSLLHLPGRKLVASVASFLQLADIAQ